MYLLGNVFADKIDFRYFMVMVAFLLEYWKYTGSHCVHLQIICKIQYTDLEIQFQSVKCTVVTRLCKNFEQLFIPSQVIQDDNSVLMYATHFKKFSNVLVLYIITEIVL